MLKEGDPESDKEEKLPNNLEGEASILVAKVFLNHLIVPQILDYLSVADCKAFRLVCRDWYKNSIKLESKKAFVHLRTCDVTTAENSHHSSYSINSFLDFIETPNQSTEFLGRCSFQNFSLENWSIEDEQNGHQNLETYLRFTEIFGSRIRHLRMINFHFEKENETFYNLVRKLAPNMTTLEIVADKASQARSWPYSFEFLSPLYLKADVHHNLRRLEIYWAPNSATLRFSFLLKFPNLKELKLKSIGEGRGCMGKCIPTLCLMRPLRRKLNALKLTHLDVIDTNQNFVGFVEAELPLKYLSLNVNEAGSYSFNIVLEHHAKLLETLKLIRVPSLKSPPFINFPFLANFENLKELELWGNMTKSLDFLLVTPVLKRLRVDLYCFEKRDTFPEVIGSEGRLLAIPMDLVQNSYKLIEKESFSIPSLEEFRIESVLGVESWKILGDWLPNLMILEAPLNNDTFEVVCSQWTNLSRLKLRLGSEVDDNGITGLGDVSGRKVNITDLKHLRSFELEVLCGQARLANDAAAQGFLQLKNLSSLRIHVSEFMSLEVEDKLKSAIENVHIFRGKHGIGHVKRQYGKGWTEGGVCCIFTADYT